MPIESLTDAFRQVLLTRTKVKRLAVSETQALIHGASKDQRQSLCEERWSKRSGMLRTTERPEAHVRALEGQRFLNETVKMKHQSREYHHFKARREAPSIAE
jgi:hypothetical protein